MALPATDTFTDTDSVQIENHGGGIWTLNAGAMDIRGNKCCPDVAGVESAAHRNDETWANDQYALGTLISASAEAARKIGAAVRVHASAATYYGLYAESAGGGTIILFKNVAGSWTQLGSTNSAGWATGQELKITAEGTDIKAYLDGVQLTPPGTQSDAAIAAGSGGVCAYGDTPNNGIDDWESGDLAGGAAVAPTSHLYGPLVGPLGGPV